MDRKKTIKDATGNNITWPCAFVSAPNDEINLK